MVGQRLRMLLVGGGVDGQEQAGMSSGWELFWYQGSLWVVGRQGGRQGRWAMHTCKHTHMARTRSSRDLDNMNVFGWKYSKHNQDVRGVHVHY